MPLFGDNFGFLLVVIAGTIAFKFVADQSLVAEQAVLESDFATPVKGLTCP